MNPRFDPKKKCADCINGFSGRAGMVYCLRANGVTAEWERASTLPGAEKHGKTCGPEGQYFVSKPKYE